MFLLMQDRADGHWPTDDNPSGDVWMYYMGSGMWIGKNTIEQAHKFETREDAQAVIDHLKRQADYALTNMTYLPCTGAYKIIPYE